MSAFSKTKGSSRTSNGRTEKLSLIPDEPDASSHVYDPTETYEEFSVGRGLTVQLVWITLEIAKEWITLVGKTQRPMKKNHLASLIDDLECDLWRLNGSTIIFDSDGFLNDGQHRLAAVIETGKPILSLVVRNVDPSAYAAIDNTAKRKGADALSSSNYQNANVLAAAANLLRRYEGKFIRGMGHTTFITTSPLAVVETLREHPGLADSVVPASLAGRFCGNWSAATFCHYIFAGIDKGAANLFFEKFGTGEELKKGDPILTLRNRCIKSQDEKKHIERDLMINYIFKAWNYWRKGKMLHVMSCAAGDSLPLPI